MAVTTKITGLRELGEAMKELKVDMRFRTSDAAIRKGANIVRNSARQLAPQAEKPHKLLGVMIQPGNLKRNIITSKTKRTKLTSEFDVRVRVPKNLTLKAKAAGNIGAFYWRFIEFGTGTWRKIGARSFMRRGFMQSREEAQEAIVDALAKGIERARRKAKMPPKPVTKAGR